MATLRTRSGTKLTKKAVDALAAEAERGYDLSKAKRVRMGRPSLGDAGTSPRVQVRVDADLAEALQAVAQKEQRSVSEIARTALREYLERRPGSIRRSSNDEQVEPTPPITRIG